MQTKDYMKDHMPMKLLTRKVGWLLAAMGMLPVLLFTKIAEAQPNEMQETGCPMMDMGMGGGWMMAGMILFGLLLLAAIAALVALTVFLVRRSRTREALPA